MTRRVAAAALIAAGVLLALWSLAYGSPAWVLDLSAALHRPRISILGAIGIAWVVSRVRLWWNDRGPWVAAMWRDGLAAWREDNPRRPRQ